MPLSTALQPGTLLIGLANIMRGGPGVDANFRVVDYAGKHIVEFFAGVGGAGTEACKILPYVPNAMNTVTCGTIETISGEFTGCVMALYRQGAALKCAHVDTNKDTSQRAAYDALKATSGVTMVDECDTTGMLPGYPQVTLNTRVLCLAANNAIIHYFVERELHQFSGQAQVAGAGKGSATTFGVINETRYKVLNSMGH